MTAHTMEHEKGRSSAAAGMNDFIGKPFDTRPSTARWPEMDSRPQAAASYPSDRTPCRQATGSQSECPPGLALNEIDSAAGLARFAGNEHATGTG
jgi:hypothetical protein